MRQAQIDDMTLMYTIFLPSQDTNICPERFLQSGRAGTGSMVTLAFAIAKMQSVRDTCEKEC